MGLLIRGVLVLIVGFCVFVQMMDNVTWWIMSIIVLSTICILASLKYYPATKEDGK